MATDNFNQDQPQSSGNVQNPQCPVCSCFSRRWYWFAIVALGVIAVIIFTNQSSPPNVPDTPAIIWGHDYQAALEQQKTQNKPILLAFHASWCPPCREMKKTTYHNPEVLEISKSFICVMIDYDTQKSLVDQYSIRAIPAYVMLRPDGTTIESFVGYHPPTDFLAKLKTAIQ
jgi:thiol-disulfide isomerase/thioredoxin